MSAIGSAAMLHPLRQFLQPSGVFTSAILVGLAYYLGAQAAFYLGTLSDKIFAPFWPPNIILFCALLLVPERRWWHFVAAAFPAHVAAELQVGMPWPQLMVAFVTNCTVALLNAFAVRRLLGDPPWFASLRKTGLYILITAGVSPAVAALGGAFVPILGGGATENYWAYWTYWYSGNALNSLTLGAAFLTWTSEGPHASALTTRRRIVEAAVLTILLVVVCMVAFEVNAKSFASGFLPAVFYAPLPFVLWSTVRFGAKGASTAIMVVTLVLIWRTFQGSSLFVGSSDPEMNVLALQLFLIGLSAPVLLLGATIDELRHAEQLTRQLAGSILSAQDQERRRIARDLHDTTGQNLIVASLLVERLRKAVPDAERATVQQLGDTVQQSISEVRTLSYLLHPPLLDEAGLDAALQHYVEGFSQRSGLRVDLDVASDLDRLPDSVELALFRVVQEALSNVTRHSGSPTAHIQLNRYWADGRRYVRLAVRDNGNGTAVAGSKPNRSPRSQSGLGLASMRERLHQIGGRLELESASGSTVVTALVPLGDEPRPSA
jgi:signal transduction histidine kinase